MRWMLHLECGHRLATDEEPATHEECPKCGTSLVVEVEPWITKETGA
jgi:predicted RNA-binding Zn-ribbon protein involved in translation (DUF1610 family)